MFKDAAMKLATSGGAALVASMGPEGRALYEQLKGLGLEVRPVALRSHSGVVTLPCASTLLLPDLHSR